LFLTSAMAIGVHQTMTSSTTGTEQHASASL
jgi:hypothetical protein